MVQRPQAKKNLSCSGDCRKYYILNMTPTSSNRKEDSTPELNLNYFERDDQSKFMIRDLNAAF